MGSFSMPVPPDERCVRVASYHSTEMNPAEPVPDPVVQQRRVKRRRASLVRRFVVYPVLLLAVITLPMAIPGIADRLVLFPSTDPIDTMGASRIETRFEGGSIEIWTARSPGAVR